MKFTQQIATHFARLPSLYIACLLKFSVNVYSNLIFLSLFLHSPFIRPRQTRQQDPQIVCIRFTKQKF